MKNQSRNVERGIVEKSCAYAIGDIWYSTDEKKHLVDVCHIGDIRSKLPDPRLHDEGASFCVTVSHRKIRRSESAAAMTVDGCDTPLVNLFFTKVNISEDGNTVQVWKLKNADIFFGM